MTVKRFWLALQVLATLILLGVLFRDFDWPSLLTLIRTLPIWFYLVSLATLFVGQLLYALKWKLVLNSIGAQLPFRTLAKQYLIAVFFNNFLPTTVGGDAARIYYLGTQRGFVMIGSSVLLDRLFGALSVTAWATLLTWFVSLNNGAFVLARNLLSISFALQAALLSVLLFAPGTAPVDLLQKAPLGLSKLAKPLNELLSIRDALTRSAGLLIQVPLIVLVYYMLLAAVYQTYFATAGGQATGYLPVLAVLLTIAILSNVPITINGIGLREQLHFVLFGSLALSKELAVGISLIVFSQLLILSLLGYYLWVRMRLEEEGTLRLIPQVPEDKQASPERIPHTKRNSLQPPG